MIRIIDSRGSGKTSRLMLIAKEAKATFVCSQPALMKKKAEAYGIIGLNFMSYTDFLDSREKNIGPYVIDELNMFTNCATNLYAGKGQLVGYTLSNED